MIYRFRKVAIPALLVAVGMTGMPALSQEQWETIEGYCFGCHNDEDWAGSVAFNLMSADEISHEAEIFEEAIRRLNGGHMPPPGAERPATGSTRR